MSKRKDRERAENGIVYRSGLRVPFPTREQLAQVDKAVEMRLEELRKEEKHGRKNRRILYF